MAQGLKSSRKRRPRSDGALKAAVSTSTETGAILTCPFCGFLALEHDLLLHMEGAHAEGQLPSAASEAQGRHDSGPSTRLGGSETRYSQNNGNSNGAKVADPTEANPTSKSHLAVETVTVGAVSPGSSISDDSVNDDHANEEVIGEEQLRFAECPLEGCQESLLATEMGYHIDLHAALDYRERVADDDSTTTSTDILPATTTMATEGRPVTLKAKARSSAIPPEARKEPVSASSNRGDSDRKQHASYAQPTEGDQSSRDQGRDAQDGGKSCESHRKRRERKRSGHDQIRDRDQCRSGTNQHKTVFSLSALVAQDRAHQTSLFRRASSTTRPRWSFWSGSAPKKSSAAEGKARETSIQRAEPAMYAKSSSAKAAVSKSREPKRLGKAELGKYADEDRMPDILAVYLKKEWGIRQRGIIPVLNQLLEQSPTTEYAYLCDPCVQHVSRLPKEGGFCGYRNLQTLISYIVGAEFPGYEQFGKDLPSIFDLQNFIEDAWDKGINPRGRIETGGIRWSRKYIGTPEAVTLFQSLNIPCTVRAFKHKKPDKAKDLMLRDVEEYFQMGNYVPGRKVRATSLPPIYWQHRGHSLTIVGIEKTKTGATNLLVFDPIFRNGSTVTRLVGHRRIKDHFPDQLLNPYRRGSRYLMKYRAFELLKLRPNAEDVINVGLKSIPIRCA